MVNVAVKYTRVTVNLILYNLISAANILWVTERAWKQLLYFHITFCSRG